MNQSNTTLANSTLPVNSQPLTTLIADIFNVYVLPPLCLVGIILNALSVRTTHKLRQTCTFFYMEISALSDLSFLAINSFLFIIRCGSLCSLGYTYVAKFYEIYIYLFVGSSLLMYSSLIDIIIVFDQYFIIKNKSFLQKINKIYILLPLALVSLALSTPTFLIREIGQRTFYTNGVDSTLFVLASNDLGKSDLGRVISVVYGIYRGLVLLVFIFIGNMLLTLEFKKYVSKKQHLRSRTGFMTNNSNYFFSFVCFECFKFFFLFN
jgi:hypothetical protein